MQKIAIVFSLALFANLLSAQNVGIGTNSPSSKLHVVGGVKVENSELELVNSKLIFNDPFDNMRIGEFALQNHLSGRENIGIGKFALNMLEDGNGNIAIGSKAGERSLFGSYNIFIGYDTSTKGSNSCIAIGYLAGISQGNKHSTAIGNSSFVSSFSNYSTAIGYGAWAVGNNSIALGRSGDKVAIGGNVFPSAQLDLGGDNKGSSGDNIQLRLGGTLNEGTNNGSTGGTFKLKIEGYNNDGPKVYPIYAIDENLQVDFYVRNRPSEGGNATLYIAGNALKPGGGFWTASSDIRLKKEITPYEEGLEKINQIRPVRFKYNALSTYNTSEEHIGVIAQEIQNVAPYMVSDHEINGEEYLQVDNSSMVFMLINAVQELNKINHELETRIELLEKQQCNCN